MAPVQGRFVSGTKVPIAGGAGRIDVDVIIPDKLSQNFNVIRKDYMPSNAGGIVWLNNVGLQAKSGNPNVDDYYEVQITRTRIPPQAQKVRKVYIWVNNAAQELNSSDFATDWSGLVTLRLNIADPAIGVGG
jgi:hypothetical protein